MKPYHLIIAALILLLPVLPLCAQDANSSAQTESPNFIGSTGGTFSAYFGLNDDNRTNYTITPWIEFMLSERWALGVQMSYQGEKYDENTINELWGGMYVAYYTPITTKFNIEHIFLTMLGTDFKGASTGVSVGYSPVLLYPITSRLVLSFCFGGVTYLKEIGSKSSGIEFQFFDTTTIGFSISF